MSQFKYVAGTGILIMICVTSLFLASYMGIMSGVGSTAVSAQDVPQTDQPQHTSDQPNSIFTLEATTNPPLLVNSGPYETVITITNISGGDFSRLKLSLFLEGGASIVEVNPPAPVFSTLTLWQEQVLAADQSTVYRVIYNISDAVPVDRIVGEWTVDSSPGGATLGTFTVTRPLEQIYLPAILHE